MDETIIEIPQPDTQEGWQPPTLTQNPDAKPRDTQRVSDVFFIQYVICLLLITAFFTARCFAPEYTADAAQAFLAHTHAPDAPPAAALLSQLQ